MRDCSSLMPTREGAIFERETENKRAVREGTLEICVGSGKTMSTQLPQNQTLLYGRLTATHHVIPIENWMCLELVPRAETLGLHAIKSTEIVEHSRY